MSPNDDEQQILKLHLEGDKALMSADIEALARIFADDYVQYNDSGQPLSTSAPDSAAGRVFAEIAERISSEILPPVDMAGCTARMLADVEEKLGASP